MGITHVGPRNQSQREEWGLSDLALGTFCVPWSREDDGGALDLRLYSACLGSNYGRAQKKISGWVR